MYLIQKTSNLPLRKDIRSVFSDLIKKNFTRTVIADWARDFISDSNRYPGDHIVIDALIFLATIDQTSSNHEYRYTKDNIEQAYKAFEQAIVIAEHRKDLYTKIMVGRELKWLVLQESSIENVAQWASEIYLNYRIELEDGLDDTLSTLHCMTEGPEFELNKEQLLALAHSLINQA